MGLKNVPPDKSAWHFSGGFFILPDGMEAANLSNSV